MKILPSSLREKKRYLAFRLDYEGDDPIDRKALLDDVYFATQSLLGDAGSAEIGYRLMDFDGRRGVLRVSLGAVEAARAALATVHTIKGQRATIAVAGTSGTIRAATEKYIASEDIPSTNILSMQVSGTASGIAVREKGDEIDIVPDDREALKRGNTRWLGLASSDITVINQPQE
jgi:ribonuclease P/MRP protein subunit POP5